MVDKDFDNWNQVKKIVHVRDDMASLFFREGEVWWCSMGLNVGFEHDGKGPRFVRPVLILRKFSKDVFFGIPLSTTKKKGKFYFEFQFLDGESTALLSQLRIFDARRLVDKMGSVSPKIVQEIRERTKSLL